MNRLLMLFYCMTSCLIPCLSQDKVPPLVLQQLLKKERPDTNDLRMLFNTGISYVDRPGIEPGDMDSAALCAAKVLKSAVSIGNKVWEGQSYLLFSKILREQNDIVRGKSYALKAEAVFKEHQQKELLADTYMELCDYYQPVDIESLNVKLKYYREAAVIYGELGLKLKQANALYRLGDYYSFLPDYNEAKKVLLQALPIFQELHVKELQGIYNLLGAICSQLGDSDNALKYGLMSLKTAQAVGDSTTQLCTIYNRLGMIYIRVEDVTKAMQSFRKAEEIALRLKDTPSMQILARNIGQAYQKMNKPAEALKILKEEERYYPPTSPEKKILMLESILNAYCLLGDFERGAPYAQQLEDMRHTMYPDDAYLEYVYTALVNYYLGIHQFNTAHQYAQVMLAVASKSGNLSFRAKSCSFLYRADSAMANYKEALEHFRLYKQANDSLFNIAKMQKIGYLQVEFETEQKDQALTLKERNIELLTKEAQEARFTRNVIIGGAGMLVALLLLGYNRYQLKLRSNRQLKQQQDEINRKNLSLHELIASQNKLLDEKEWLVKEIHHRVKNNLQIVMSLLNTQAAFLDDKDALNAIRESRYRMQAISLIHQKLYQSDNMARIDMRTYINELVVFLKDGFSDVSRIKFDLQIAPVRLDVSQSVPVGLILNEAITNAIKYAFTGNGTIIVSLQPADTGYLTLVIADNGKGFPEGEIPTQRGSMGMMLMHTLAEQLDGVLDIQSRNGVTITVSFRYEEKETFDKPVVLMERVADYA
ncbi:histidine kinase dimerization/phosphoacceptor domain -containing protein [Chitinophaga sp. CF418]|uniref:tetratricopeptide repeat-containing sensor histidine kinase n=1 Tax=Chitinophaga sp. CF418 TaxID=1855287 RepID=UPI00091C294E|nr:histidine kinase dimerization/phosphoacceptor domain -containing protein [Chitinophaga sp. CF418]SHN43137.1 Two-component sensor histidine kinase, contains HisKA and HATPase domains [Chitinophaga sp. CF418]